MKKFCTLAMISMIGTSAAFSAEEQRTELSGIFVVRDAGSITCLDGRIFHIM
jgi:hypothetical protein